MSKKITKKQHYVWRSYLRAWSLNDKIFAYLKNKDEIIYTDLMNLAQQRYFYKFNKFSKLEKEFLKHTCSEVKGPIRQMLDDLLFDLNLFNELKEIQEKITSNILEPLDELEKNGYEQLQGIIENQGKKIIACRTLEDLYFLEDDMSKFETLMFLCFQYFRTKKQKDSQVENFKNEILDIENIFSVLVIINSSKVAQNIFFDPKIRYILLEIINNEVYFIKGDQPVINLLAEEKDDNGYTKDLAFYYPIAPKYAIKIEFNNKGNKYQHICIDKEQVLILNNMIISESNEFIFSNSKDYLKKSCT